MFDDSRLTISADDHGGCPEDEVQAHFSGNSDNPAPAGHRLQDASKAIWENEGVLAAFFTDESSAFRQPAEPEPCEEVTVRLRVEKGVEVSADLLVGSRMSRVPMAKAFEDDLFCWYEASFMCGIDTLAYRFCIEWHGKEIVYQKDGAHWADQPVDPKLDFRLTPGFHTPSWAWGALQYQIFPDRFANGDKSNDVVDREYAYDGKPVSKALSWDALPAEDDYRCFYGGDLQGVIDKLDYLQSLGVEAIYFNPIFLSPSSHGYDTQNYNHIDPHLGVIREDVDMPLQEHDCCNDHALQYILRTTSKENLSLSDDLFARLCAEAHRRGIRIILDGVFNHCGSFSSWMDREGVYRHADGKKPGAFQSLESPYRHYFHFEDVHSMNYEGWWHFKSLPKLNYEGAPDLVDAIMGVARKWASPPYSIDGWRLDVAADLGLGVEYNHVFWRRFRRELKTVNPNLLIIAEHYGDASAWLQGDQWDTVMNYDAFMDPLTFFLTGMEKHSDRIDEGLYQDGAAFCKTMRDCMARFGWGSLLCAMNELSNHDHSRFLTRTNRTVGRIGTAGSAAAGEGIDKRVLREAVVVQMTWPGAPTIYYGDEAGQVGWTDPDCRRTYPWGSEDQGLINLHRTLAQLRKRHLSLRTGSFVLLGGGKGWIAFGRFLGRDHVAVVCNNGDVEQTISLRVRTIGMEDGYEPALCLQTTEDGFSVDERVVGVVSNGCLTVTVPACTAFVFA